MLLERFVLGGVALAPLAARILAQMFGRRVAFLGQDQPASSSHRCQTGAVLPVAERRRGNSNLERHWDGPPSDSMRLSRIEKLMVLVVEKKFSLRESSIWKTGTAHGQAKLRSKRRGSCDPMIQDQGWVANDRGSSTCSNDFCQYHAAPSRRSSRKGGNWQLRRNG
jgi:hypothetical protein